MPNSHEAKPGTLLLDLDGTLTDPGPGIFNCVAFALAELECPAPTASELRHWIGPPLLQSFTRWFEQLALDRDPEHALRLYRRRFASEGLFENSVYPGIPGQLELLASAGSRLLLATAKPEVYALRIVEHFGLIRNLQGVYGSELNGTRTDKAELLAHILGRENLDAKECMMIGDREHDMLAARHHGMQAVGVLWGYGSERELIDAGADRLITEPQQLGDILEPCNAARPR